MAPSLPAAVLHKHWWQQQIKLVLGWMEPALQEQVGRLSQHSLHERILSLDTELFIFCSFSSVSLTAGFSLICMNTVWVLSYQTELSSDAPFAEPRIGSYSPPSILCSPFPSWFCWLIGICFLLILQQSCNSDCH